MELNSKGTLLIGALEREREYLKSQIAKIDDCTTITEEFELRLSIRKGGYEILLESLEEQLKELKRIRELEMKIKDKNISKVEMLELLKIMSDTLN